MKILHIMNYYQENMGYQENWLPYYQKKLGNEVEILTSDRYFPFPNYDNSMKNILGERILKEDIYFDKDIKIIRKKSFFEIVKKSIIVFDVSYIEKFKPDIIHLHGITNLNIFQILKYVKKYDIKLFVDSHSDYQVSNYTSVFNQLYYKFWRMIYKKIDKDIKQYLPITQEAKKFLLNEFLIAQNKITINYLGVDLNSFFYDEYLKNKLIKQYKLQNKIIFINAGKQYESKRLDIVITIVKKLILDYKLDNIILILIGNATQEYKGKIDNLSKDIKDYIIRVPFVKNKELKGYYSLADIGIWPGIPSNTIQEAMACEVSVILAKNETTSHLILENGFCIDKDIDEIAEKLYKIINEKKLEVFKKNSRKIIEKYSWENIAMECLNIYNQN